MTGFRILTAKQYYMLAQKIMHIWKFILFYFLKEKQYSRERNIHSRNNISNFSFVYAN